MPKVRYTSRTPGNKAQPLTAATRAALLTTANRAVILRQAADLLQTRWPRHVRGFHNFHGIKMVIRIDWPGVVVVTDRETGEVIVTSRPGQPTEPAEVAA